MSDFSELFPDPGEGRFPLSSVRSSHLLNQNHPLGDHVTDVALEDSGGGVAEEPHVLSETLQGLVIETRNQDKVLILLFNRRLRLAGDDLVHFVPLFVSLSCLPYTVIIA